ncbi:metallophosphoesterase [Clostridium massiliamazoniense]|uniref:metallophosphoesterase n=1 Tax=Clostridium massiliamazoniense TaxID=1347366 RepID=UPI0006D774F7|nr:metallophosphoesterase [Clostridium massiliamazoniense]
MSRYVMSDLHGCYDDYIEMLNLIEFSKEDELYILGDIFDRGSKALEIYEHIVANENIHLIKGNHEQLVENYFKEEGFKSIKDLNGIELKYGIDDIRAKLIFKGIEYQKNLYEYLKELPVYKAVNNFILVHGGLTIPDEKSTLKEILDYNPSENLLWYRNHIGNEKYHCKYKIICGHTPTISIEEDGKILRRKSYIYIDCGCSFREYGGYLGCLDLDNEMEYYI